MMNLGKENFKSTIENTFVTWNRQRDWHPLKIVSAEGCYFEDSAGNKYLDMSSQLMCSNLGHGNKGIIEAIKKQADKLAYIAPSFDTDVREEVSQKLKSVLPDNLTKFSVCDYIELFFQIGECLNSIP